MGMAGAFFDVMDEARDVFMRVMMADAVKLHILVAAGAGDTVAMDHAPDALVKQGAALRATHPHLDVFDRIAHGRIMTPKA